MTKVSLAHASQQAPAHGRWSEIGARIMGGIRHDAILADRLVVCTCTIRTKAQSGYSVSIINEYSLLYAIPYTVYVAPRHRCGGGGEPGGTELRGRGARPSAPRAGGVAHANRTCRHTNVQPLVAASAHFCED
jgi:hypothetical protein